MKDSFHFKTRMENNELDFDSKTTQDTQCPLLVEYFATSHEERLSKIENELKETQFTLLETNELLTKN